MSEPRYPDESPEYRKARDELLEEEKGLVEKVKSVAKKRRQLPLGGRLKEDYKFQWANDGKVGEEVRFSELFGDMSTLLLYNFMYGPGWALLESDGSHARRTAGSDDAAAELQIRIS